MVPPNWANNDNFPHRKQVIKKALCCNPQIHQKVVFHKLSFLKDKNFIVEVKHNLR